LYADNGCGDDNDDDDGEDDDDTDDDDTDDDDTDDDGDDNDYDNCDISAVYCTDKGSILQRKPRSESGPLIWTGASIYLLHTLKCSKSMRCSVDSTHIYVLHILYSLASASLQ